MQDSYTVVHNTDQSRFEIQAEGKVAELNYVLRPGRIIYTSTHVPRSLEGRGVGSALVKTGLEYARANQLSVVPNCSFVRSYLRRHPEYGDLTGS
jgi:predicted GNAT family acetyltransferase